MSGGIRCCSEGNWPTKNLFLSAAVLLCTNSTLHVTHKKNQEMFTSCMNVSHSLGNSTKLSKSGIAEYHSTTQSDLMNNEAREWQFADLGSSSHVLWNWSKSEYCTGSQEFTQKVKLFQVNIAKPLIRQKTWLQQYNNNAKKKKFPKRDQNSRKQTTITTNGRAIHQCANLQPLENMISTRGSPQFLDRASCTTACHPHDCTKQRWSATQCKVNWSLFLGVNKVNHLCLLSLRLEDKLFNYAQSMVTNQVQ